MSDKDFIPMAAPVIGEREVEYVTDAVRSGWISSQGRYVTEFEAGFSRFCGSAHGVAVSSGTTALHLALVTLGVGDGNEVILPPITHIAVPNAVVLAGATPVLADCERSTWCLDPAALEAKVTQRTRAIVVVHLYGHPADMDPILEIARRHKLAVIEDAAEAHGAEYRGRRAGSLGDIGCFSFYANKIITTGEGGMLVTGDAGLAARARKLRDQAYEPERRFEHRELGFNYRLTNVQAAIGLAQLARIDEFIARRRRHAELYRDALQAVSGLTLAPEAPWARSVFWMYSLLVGPPLALDRNGLAEGLRKAGIDSRPFFLPVHQQPLYQERFRGQHYPVAEELAQRGINLPSGNELTDDQVTRVANAARAVAERSIACAPR